MSIGVEGQVVVIGGARAYPDASFLRRFGAHAMTTGAWKLSESFSLSRLQGLSQNVGSQIRENAGREVPIHFCLRRNANYFHKYATSAKATPLRGAWQK